MRDVVRFVLSLVLLLPLLCGCSTTTTVAARNADLGAETSAALHGLAAVGQVDISDHEGTKKFGYRIDNDGTVGAQGFRWDEKDGKYVAMLYRDDHMKSYQYSLFIRLQPTGETDKFDLEVSLFDAGAQAMLQGGALVNLEVDHKNGFVHLRWDGQWEDRAQGAASGDMRPFVGDVRSKIVWRQ